MARKRAAPPSRVPTRKLTAPAGKCSSPLAARWAAGGHLMGLTMKGNGPALLIVSSRSALQPRQLCLLHKYAANGHGRWPHSGDPATESGQSLQVGPLNRTEPGQAARGTRAHGAEKAWGISHNLTQPLDTQNWETSSTSLLVSGKRTYESKFMPFFLCRASILGPTFGCRDE